jgi:hypothetical protein
MDVWPSAFAVPYVSARRNPGVCAKQANLTIFRWLGSMAMPKEFSICSASLVKNTAADRWSLSVLLTRTFGALAFIPYGHQMITSPLLGWAVTTSS